MCLQPPGAGDLGDLSRVLLDRKLIQRKRRRLVLDLQVALVHPNRDIFPGQAQFAIQTPMFEFHKAMPINLAGELGGIQGP